MTQMTQNPRKLTNEELIKIVDDYLVYKVNGNPRELKYTSIAEYGKNTTGVDLADRDFSRNALVRAHIEGLKTGTCTVEGVPAVICYHPLNIDKVIKEMDYSSLISHLRNMNSSCQKMVDSYNKLRADSLVLRKKLDEANQEIQFLKSQSRQQNDTDIEEEYRQCRQFIKKNFYPDIAKVLYEQSGKSVAADTASTVLKETELANLVEGRNAIPLPVSTQASDTNPSSDTIDNVINFMRRAQKIQGYGAKEEPKNEES